MSGGTFSLHIQGPMTALRALMDGYNSGHQQDEAGGQDRRDVITSLEKERDDAIAALADSQERLRVVTAAKNEIAARFAGVCDEKRDAEAALERLQSLLDDRCANIESLKQIVEATRGEVSAYEESYRSSKIEAAAAQRNANEALDQLRVAKVDIATLQKRIADMEKERDEAGPVDTVASDIIAPAQPETKIEVVDTLSSARTEELQPATDEPDLVAELSGHLRKIADKIGGARARALAFVAIKSPTLAEFMAAYGCEKQSAFNRISSMKTMARNNGVAVTLGADGRYRAGLIKNAEAEPIAPASPEIAPAAVAVAEKPAGEQARSAPAPQAPQQAGLAAPSSGTLCRVSVPLLTVRGPKASGRVQSSLFGKVLAHMADGQMYGLSKLRTVGGYATEDALKLAFSTHRTMLERVGLIIWSDKINAKLKVLG